MNNSKNEKDTLKKDDRISNMIISPRLYAIGIVLMLVLTIACILLNGGIGSAIFLVLLILNFLFGLMIEIDAQKVFQNYLKYKKLYENIENEDVEIEEKNNDKEFYNICKRNFGIFKIMTILTFATVIVSYLFLSFSNTSLFSNNSIMGNLPNVATTAVVTMIGIALCYTNACYKKDLIQRYQFMCNNYRDLCLAHKNRKNSVNIKQ